ncbi:MAG: signal peptidase I [Clostridia bacterium]|nr:signal peptidase I [Clostridia bacterium]
MTAKKVFGVVKTVLVWIVVAIAVFMMVFTIVSVNTFDQNDRSLFGFKFFVVQTDSMKATDFAAGDIVISQEVDVTTLKAGDIITFVSESSHNYGETVTHKIREVTRNDEGDIAFVTYGTTTDTNDEALATVIVGKYLTSIPKLGAFFMFLQTTPGYIVCILIPFLLLILSQGINVIRLFRRYRKEQMEAMQAEREKLEQEREESQKMMLELLALKAQLANGEAPAAATPTPAVEEKPAEAAPTVEEKPAEAAPTVEEKATEAAPAVEEKPAEAAPAVEEKNAEAAPTVEEKPAEAAPTVEEKTAETAPEADDIAAMKEKLEREMQELMALKAQLAAQVATNETKPTEEAPKADA